MKGVDGPFQGGGVQAELSLPAVGQQPEKG